MTVNNNYPSRIDSAHYSLVKNWFDTATGNDIRDIDSEYGYVLYARYLLEKLNIPTNATVLEIGCGDGVIMNKMTNLRPDITFYGIDISKNMIEQAKAKNPKCNFHVGNIIDGIPFAEKFDRIYSFSVFQYLFQSDIIKSCILCLNHISNDGIIYHFSLPDIKRRLPKLIDASLSQYSSFFAILVGIFMSLFNIDNKYYKDGSYWHSSNAIKMKLLKNISHNGLHINIERSLICWFRFDISISKNLS